jgi:hypothetical protein
MQDIVVIVCFFYGLGFRELMWMLVVLGDVLFVIVMESRLSL